MGENILHSVIAPKAKLYSMSMGDKKKLSAKGTSKYAQKVWSNQYSLEILQQMLYSELWIIQ